MKAKFIIILGLVTIVTAPTNNLNSMHEGLGCMTDTECETGIEDASLNAEIMQNLQIEPITYKKDKK